VELGANNVFNKDWMMEKRYVSGKDGWLNVKREPAGVEFSFPSYLQVELIKTGLGREFFKPTEGPERGKLFSVIAGNLSKMPFITKVRRG
jgi:hypothetical protein